MNDQGLRAVEGGADRDQVERRPLRDQARHRRPGRDARARLRLPARRRAPADRGRPRPRQDADRSRPSPRCSAAPSSACSSRPTSCPPTSSARASTARASEAFDDRARPGLLQLPPRRRDQPRAREGAVGAARGDAGAPGDDRRGDASGPGAVPRDGDAEPDRVRGHLPAARGAGRPLHAQGRRRLPAPRRTS